MQQLLIDNDHKLIGEKYKLFFFDKKVPGQVMLLPKGQIMFHTLETIIRKLMIKDNYQEIKSGTFGLKNIWEKTKHTQKYSSNIFFINNYILKPMNCPMHMIIAKKIYKLSSILPIKLFEFNYCYRNEKSGSICGMFRLNRFTQDDSHVIQTIDKINDSITYFLKNIQTLYKLFNFNKIKFRLSTIEQKNYIGSNTQRIKLQKILKNTLIKNNIDYFEENDGAFYAPKIDIIIHDAQNRQWQTGTIQIDTCLIKNSNFQLQNQHKISNTCVIHQALLGTFERFIAILLEHHGKIPKIINPYQISIILIQENLQSSICANKIIQNIVNIKKNTIDIIIGKHLNEKIIKSRKLKYEYQIVIGTKEIETKQIEIMNNNTQEKQIHNIDTQIQITI